jgi:hypothetical protein
MARAVLHDVSACFARYEPEDLKQSGIRAEGAPTPDEIALPMPTATEARTTIYVVGDFK